MRVQTPYFASNRTFGSHAHLLRSWASVCRGVTRCLRLVVGLSFALAAGGSQAVAVAYRVDLLSTLDGTHGVANGLNNLGQVVGYVYTPSTGGGDVIRAAVWSGQTATYLPSLGGTSSYAFGINDRGQIVGFSDVAGNAAYRATMWNGTTAMDLGVGTLGGTHSVAYGINESGVAVGYSYTEGNASTRATLWSGGAATHLDPVLGGTWSWAVSINEAGRAVGSGDIAGGSTSHALLWMGSTTFDLDVAAAGSSQANSVNDLGQVVGFRDNGTGQRATLWSNGVANDLGTLGGLRNAYASAINNAGQIVGTSETVDGVNHATLWSNGEVIDLNWYLGSDFVAAGWILRVATGINENGWISGIATNLISGQDRGFLASVSVVPAPQTATLVLVGLAATAVAGRRRRAAQG